MTRSLKAVAGAVLALVLTGCSAPMTADPPSTATPSTQPTNTAEEVEIPDTPAGKATQWVLDEMSGDDESDAADWEERLTEQFQKEVSAKEVAALINTQIRPARPLVATAYQGSPDQAVTTVAGALGEPFDLSIAVDDRQRISGLHLKPAAPPRTPAAALDEVAERLSELPGETRALVELDGETVLDRDPDAVAPLGSMFKLYVLGAVADAVQSRTLGWDDELTVMDAVRSLPSGTLQDAPDGTKVTVREAAVGMISVSDNTATDLLIDAVGRDAVERAVADMGHHDPGVMRPFLKTRELFALAYGDHDDLRERWQRGDEKERRAVLDELRARPFEVTAADVEAEVRWDGDLEWFATASDIARAHRELAARAEPVVLEALTKNPGLSFDAATWPSIAFKGGSDTGVLTGSWRAVRDDGSVLTVVVMSSDDEPITPASQSEMFGLVEDVFTLLAD